MNTSQPTYDDLLILMKELFVSQKDTDRKFQETDRKFQETDRMFQDTDSFLVEHVLDIRNSYRQLLLKELIPDCQSDEQFAKQLFYAPFAVVSHDTAIDPVFNYANLKALELFKLSWEDFTCLPSRLSAEPSNQAERDRLLAEVCQKGYIDHYEGVRISSTGKRFQISNAVVWNLMDKNQCYKGQAAWFDQWVFL